MICYTFKTDYEDNPLINSVQYFRKNTFQSNTKLNLTMKETGTSCVETKGPQQGSCIKLEHNVPIWCQTEANSFDTQEQQPDRL
jgi:hypothetical protein